jgi:hypothetical protein
MTRSSGDSPSPTQKEKDKTPVHQEDKEIPITRGTRSRGLQLSVSSGASSVQYLLQPAIEPIGSAAKSRRRSHLQGPGEMLQFNPRTQNTERKQNVNSYTIDDDNRVRLLAETDPHEHATFASAEDLEPLVAGWPVRRLVDIWNGLPGVRPIARFENRNVAVQRIWRALQVARSSGPAQRPGRKRKRPARESKLQIVLQMLRSPEGATLEALMNATSWQAHSVRGFLSGKVRRQLALPLESFRRDGQRVYSLAATP